MVEEDKIVLKVITGSKMYGLDVEGSDTDIKGIYVPSYEDLIRYDDIPETVTLSEPDIEYHTLNKFIKLAMKQNPTILEILYANEDSILYKNKDIELLIENRDEFLTSNVYYSFYGYANEQLMRIKNAMGNASEEDKLSNAYYVLNKIARRMDEANDLNEDVLKINNVDIKEDGKYSVNVDIDVKDKDFTEVYNYLSGVNTTIKNLNRERNRNRRVKEGKLEKHAMHLLRILFTGIEVLRGEGLKVRRDKDKDFLLGVRKGEYSWDYIFEMVDIKIKEIELLKNDNALRKEINKDLVKDIYYEIMKSRSVK